MLGGIIIHFEEIKAIILQYIHEETGFGDPIHPHYEIEELTIMQLTEDRDGSCSVSFEYLFNEDGFSKNDKSHIFVGAVVINPRGVIVKKQLKESHRGVATTRKYIPRD